MSLDDVVLFVQNSFDRLVRWLRLGRAPASGRRRLLIIQIDGLARSVLEQAIAERRMPSLARLLARGHRLTPMSVGLPSSTPAFQLAAMYGVRPDIPGFHYHDKRRRADVYFPRSGDAAGVEREQARGRRGILANGSSYGCVFTGGALDNVFNFAMFRRPTGDGALRALAGFVVLVWVIVKSLALSTIELARAVMRLVADPEGEMRRGWKWLAIKLGISVWLRELFTLVVARDLYRGVPAIYVNYLDYDVVAHAYGPRHRRALRALRRVDVAIHRLWRVCRRVPEHGYDVYVLSDHGQAHCVGFDSLHEGRRLERVVFEDYLDGRGLVELRPGHTHGRNLAAGIKGFRTGRSPGLFQRFVNYLEKDFPWMLGEVKEARQRGTVRIIAAGPNAFIYFVDTERPLPIEEIEARFPGLAEDLSRDRGIGFVLARSADGPLCFWRGKRYRLSEAGAGPFAGYENLPLVLDGIRDLMAMECAADLVLYGLSAPAGHVSYVAETGAHAGPTPEEMETFVIAPAGASLPERITHPIQLYPYFVRYQEGAADAT
jgi:type I phosphodiesterase/nucleotide pyrophosphatase